MKETLEKVPGARSVESFRGDPVVYPDLADHVSGTDAQSLCFFPWEMRTGSLSPTGQRTNYEPGSGGSPL